MNVDRLMNGTLRTHPRGREVAEIMAAALRAVDPREAVRNALRRTADQAVFVGDQKYELGARGRVMIVGMGKAGAPMVEAALDVLGDAVGDGLVIVKDGHLTTSGATHVGPVNLLEAGHPVPDARGVAAAEKMATLLRDTTPDDLVLALISGGGSALSTWPSGSLTLADLQDSTALLLGCGATINELNSFRKHTTRIGGGQLARLCAPARVASLVVSDVVGSPLDVIASGPTAPDSTTYADAWRVIERHKLQDALPRTVVEYLGRGVSGAIAETPKAGDAIWASVRNEIVADNRTAGEAAAHHAAGRGYRAALLTTFLEGEAREVGRVMAALGRELAGRRNANDAAPALYVLGGETTVSLVGGNCGRGGRNQEAALGAVEGLANVRDVVLVTLATDGGDGPTDAAGAVVTGETLAQAAALGHEPHHYLRNNDAYNFFAPLDALLKPGPTLTNVNDLIFIAAF